MTFLDDALYLTFNMSTTTETTVSIHRLTDKAYIPTKGSDEAAGYDLHTIEAATLMAGERKPFKTGITVAIPPGLYGRIAPRSGLAVKKGIDVLAGVIDSDYRGEILVVLINLGQEPVFVNEGDKVAQIIIEKHHNVEFHEVLKLEDSVRGINGIGSTDVVAPK